MTKVMDYTKKVPQPTPSWVGAFLEASMDESLDLATPSRRALLVAEELTSASPNRELWLHRFAAGLDLRPSLLYALERQVSPFGPIEQVLDNITRRAEIVTRGGVCE